MTSTSTSTRAGAADGETELPGGVPGSLGAARQRSQELERLIAREPQRFRVLTGDRPTGDLHLGHYFGTLHNRVRLQDAGAQLFVVIADYQALTDRDRADAPRERVRGLVLDYLATGTDPERSAIFAHSAVPELNQLLLPFLSLVTQPELQRNPTVKDEITHSRQASVSGLMLTYPVHQAADILFAKGNLVPVGQDQLPHVEVTRLVARRFNERYPGADGAAVFPEPDALLFSYDPVNRPEVSSLVLLAALCLGRDPVSVAEEIGGGGAALLKRTVTDAVNQRFAPARARRAELAADPGYARQVLRDGRDRAREVAAATLDEVRDAMGTRY